jgi:hypothetical protein
MTSGQKGTGLQEEVTEVIGDTVVPRLVVDDPERY